MKVKDTLQIDLVYSTLTVKLFNFIHGKHRYVGSWEATTFIKKTFPSYQHRYNGTATFQDIMLWCEENFGNDWIWNFETIYFKHEKDKLLFLLRWA